MEDEKMDEAVIIKSIQLCQKGIIKHSEKGNDDRILNYITKLYQLPITVAHLQETGIGKTVNALRKYSGDVGVASRATVNKWKNMVAKDECNDDDDDTNVDDCEPMPEPDSTNNDLSPVESPESPTSTTELTRLPSKSKSENERVSSTKHSVSPERSSVPKKMSESTDKISRSRHSDSKAHHHRDSEKKHSHKSSSHQKEREHRKRDEKSKHRNKRKHDEYHQSNSSSKKKKSSDCDDNSDVADDFVKESTPHSSNDEIDDKSKSHRKNRSNSSSGDKKSSHRDKDKSSQRSKDKSKKDSSSSKDSKSKSSSSSSKSPSKDSKKKILINADTGIDSGSGASFAEALGMMGPSSSTKTPKITYKKIKTEIKTERSSPVPSTSSTLSIKTRDSSKSPNSQGVNLLAPNVKLEPLDINITPQLPEITTNYKPLGNYTYEGGSGGLLNNVRQLTEEEALSVVISSKTQRTKVYSGNKMYSGFVPTLFNICVRVLQDNIEALEYTGGVPYEILKPVLERATPNQLLTCEYHNPYLIEDSDELWELHCKKECRGKQRQELESWRDMFLRSRDEREAKLRALTVNIKQSQDKSLPVRQTKLAYVDSVVKPPRGVARKQAKYGTDKAPSVTPSSRLSAIASGSGDNKISVPNPGARAMAHSSQAQIFKPKKAPLMQKTLALIKSRFRR